ncbi:antibiotic biosynthesis monooxygenase [bacterium]|nr:antibiotic biosynthesis monooxygenase [bacterium]|tara:strand:+ start:3901 stop:4215 length:315 start_codon:yes stop_codon:yes gene_type:complete
MKYIFEITIKDGCSEEDYIQAWKNGSTIIQKQEGAQGTKLYKKNGEEGKFIAIASWESKESRDKAMENLKSIDAGVQKILSKHREYGDIEALGNFEEVAKVEPK